MRTCESIEQPFQLPDGRGVQQRDAGEAQFSEVKRASRGSLTISLRLDVTRRYVSEEQLETSGMQGRANPPVLYAGVHLGL